MFEFNKQVYILNLKACAFFTFGCWHLFCFCYVGSQR